MILLKINAKGQLEGNWDEIADLAEAYDRGCRSEEAYKAKVVSMIFDRGYEHAMGEVKDANERMLLLLSCTAGSA